MKCPHCKYTPDTQDEGEEYFYILEGNLKAIKEDHNNCCIDEKLIYACPKCKKVFIK